LPIGNATIARRWFFSAFAVSLVVAWALGAYYRRRFGSVSVAHRFAPVFWTVVFVATLVASASLPPESGEIGITMPMVVLAIGIAGVGVTGGLVRPAYLCVASACVLFSLLGVLGVPAPTIPMLFDCLVATSLISIGIADHRLLRSTLEAKTDGCSV